MNKQTRGLISSLFVLGGIAAWRNKDSINSWLNSSGLKDQFGKFFGGYGAGSQSSESIDFIDDQTKDQILRTGS